MLETGCLWSVKTLPISRMCSTDKRVVRNGNGDNLSSSQNINSNHILGLMQNAKLSASQNNNRFSSHKAIVAAYKFTFWKLRSNARMGHQPNSTCVLKQKSRIYLSTDNTITTIKVFGIHMHWSSFSLHTSSFSTWNMNKGFLFSEEKCYTNGNS